MKLMLGIESIVRKEWSVGLATRLAELLDLEPTGSSILGVPIKGTVENVRKRLQAASIVASIPGGKVRVSFHVYNDLGDVEYVSSVLATVVERSPSPHLARPAFTAFSSGHSNPRRG